MKKRQIYLLFILISSATILHAQKLKFLEEKNNTDLRQDIEISDTLKSQYLFIDHYYQGRARFHHPNCYWGYLDENQEEIESERFDWAENFSHTPFSRVDLKRGEAIINLDAEIISPIASYVNWEARGDYYLLNTYKPDRFALAGKNGKLLTSFDLNSIDYINDSLFVLGRGIRQTVFNIHQEQPPSFDFVEIIAGKSTEYFSAAKRRNRFGIINQKGKPIIPFSYKATKTFGDYPVFALQDPKTELWGFKNAQDEIILDFRYYLADILSMVISSNLIGIMEGDIWKVYDHDGVELNRFEAELELLQFSEESICLQKGQARYFINKKGDLSSDRFFQFQTVGYNSYYLYRDNRVGLFNGAGDEIIPIAYERLQLLKFPYFRALSENGKWTLVDAKQKKKLYEELDSIAINSNNNIFLQKGENFAHFDPNKGEVLADWSKEEQKIYPKLNRYLQKSDQLWYIQDSLGDRLYLRGFEEVQEVMDQYGNKVEALALRVGDNWFVEDGKSILSAPVAYQASRVLNTDFGTYFILKQERNDSIFEGLARKKDGKILAEPIYSSIAYVGEDVFVLRERNNFQSLIDTSGRLILRFKDQQDYQLSGDYILSKSIYSYEYNLYRRNGQALFRMENSRIVYADLSIGILILEKGKEMAAYNLKQEELIAWDEHYLSFQDGGLIQATKGMHKYWYDKNGNWIDCYRKKALPPLRFFDR